MGDIKVTGHRWFLFFSSYIPLYLLLIFKDIVSRLERYGFESLKNAYKINSINDGMIIVLIILTITSYSYLHRMIKGVKGSVYIKVESVEDKTSDSFLNYISIYFLSCIDLSLGSYTDILVLVAIMLVIGIIYVNHNMVYINPVLNIMKYNLYDLKGVSASTGEYVDTILMAHKDLKVKKGDTVYTNKVTSFAFAKKCLQVK